MKAILPMQKAGFEAAVKHHVRIAYGLDDDPDYVSKGFGALVAGGEERSRPPALRVLLRPAAHHDC